MGVPRGTWSYSSITSGTAIRMQPWEAALPSEPTSLVPWIPAPAKNPIHRAWRGLSGPGGITSPARSPAQSESGTYQVGLTCLLSIVVDAGGVS